MMRWRLILIVLVAAALAPGTWLRSPLPDPDYDAPLIAAKIDITARSVGEVTALGAWHLRSANAHFGSYSALLVMDDGTLLAGSDKGRIARFAKPDGPMRPAIFDWFLGSQGQDKFMVDLEAFTRDPATGAIWAAFEGTNSIARTDGRLRRAERANPAEMRGWSSNGGPEAMARLADGRFIVMAERGAGGVADGHEGLLFSGDPVAGAKAQRFGFAAPEGFSPVDMAAMPDGRVLVLVRSLEIALPPRLGARLIVADPAEIAAGELWQGREIAALERALPTDNYEGLAIEADAEGVLTLWIISDDNNVLFQRTLLLKLEWDPREKLPETEKARENSARLSETSD